MTDAFEDLFVEGLEILRSAESRRRRPDDIARLLLDLRGAVDSGRLAVSSTLWMLQLRADLITSLDFTGDAAGRSRLTKEAILDLTALLRTAAAAHRGGLDLAEAPQLGQALTTLQQILLESGAVRIDWAGVLDEVADALHAIAGLDGLEPHTLADCWLAASAARSAQLRLEFLELDSQDAVGGRFAIGRGNDFDDPTDDFIAVAFCTDPSSPGLPAGTTNLLRALSLRAHAYVAAASTWLDALRRLCVWAMYVETYVGHFQSPEDEARARGEVKACLTTGLHDHFDDLSPAERSTLANTGLELVPEAIWPRDGTPTAVPGGEGPTTLPGLLDVIKILAIAELSASVFLADPALNAMLLPPGGEDALVRRAVALVDEEARRSGWENIEYLLAAVRTLSLRSGDLGIDRSVVDAVASYFDRERGAWQAIAAAQSAASRWSWTGEPSCETVSALFSGSDFVEALQRFPHGISAYVHFLGLCLVRIEDRSVLQELLDDLERLRAYLHDEQDDLARVLALRRGQLMWAATNASPADLRVASEAVLREVEAIARVHDYPTDDVVETARSWVSSGIDCLEQRSPGQAAFVEATSWLASDGRRTPRPSNHTLGLLRARGATVLALQTAAHPAWGPISAEEAVLIRRLLDDTADAPPTGMAATESFYPMLAHPRVAARLGMAPAERIAVLKHALAELAPEDPLEAAGKAVQLTVFVHDMCEDGESFFGGANQMSEDVASRYLARLLKHDPADPLARWFLIFRARAFLNSAGGSLRMRVWRAYVLYLGYLLALMDDDLDAACNASAGLSEFFRFGSTAHRQTTDLWWHVYNLHRREGGLSGPEWNDFHEQMNRNRQQGVMP
jgi:hypothetical protein